MIEDKKEKEIQIIHKTEFIDKELPTIFYKKQNLESMSKEQKKQYLFQIRQAKRL
jgi:hypothetical protein